MVSQFTNIQTPEKRDLNKRLETIGWALFLIMIGGLGLVPNHLVPEGTWLVGVGFIMLGLNAVRYLTGIAPSGFTTALGLLALLIGTGNVFGIDLLVFPILLILLGALILLKPYFGRNG